MTGTGALRAGIRGLPASRACVSVAVRRILPMLGPWTVTLVHPSTCGAAATTAQLLLEAGVLARTEATSDVRVSSSRLVGLVAPGRAASMVLSGIMDLLGTGLESLALLAAISLLSRFTELARERVVPGYARVARVGATRRVSAVMGRASSPFRVLAETPLGDPGSNPAPTSSHRTMRRQSTFPLGGGHAQTKLPPARGGAAVIGPVTAACGRDESEPDEAGGRTGRARQRAR
jgi:hypothetical protein